jgi:hypothetical protein
LRIALSSVHHLRRKPIRFHSPNAFRIAPGVLMNWPPPRKLSAAVSALRSRSQLALQLLIALSLN